jgi:CrcB protein
MPTIIAISAGAIIGALARYYSISYIEKLFGNGFPFGTLLVNILGCFFMGALVEVFAVKLSVSNELKSFFTVGVLGAFTTFSTFAFDVALLAQRGETVNSIIYIISSVALSLLALLAGLYLMRSLL